MAFGVETDFPEIARVAEADPAASRPVSSRAWERILLGLALVLVVWPYVREPGKILYNRYFEASMIFNPVYAYQTYATGWSPNMHLGYPSLTEPSYLSLFTLAILVFHMAGGIAFASHAYPTLVALFAFGSMFAYLRLRHDALALPERTLVAFFFAVNPLTASMVHEGYSGMMIDYALLPLGLVAVDLAVSRRKPLLLGALPLAFTATSMFKLPEVAIAWGAIAFLRWNDWRSSVRRHPQIVVALIAALCVNAYWAIPMVLNLKLHAYLPVQGDTASEIAVSTQYSNLSNIVLARVFGIFENDARLCDVCGYYTSAAYTLGMASIFVLALWGCVAMRAWKPIGVIAAAIVLSTGYHYQDDLIGIPYQLLMQLPTFAIFRSSNVFLTLLFFGYACGLACALRAARVTPGRHRFVAATTLAAVVLAGWPLLNGSILEKQAMVAGRVPAPNFFVTLPLAYAAARARLAAWGSSGSTLLLPNEPFAAYRWGAYVQDFLPAYLGRPTLSTWYWKQNNPDVDALLQTVTNPAVGAERLALLMRAMRIDSVLVHADTIDGAPVVPSRYGTIAFRDGSITLVRPALEIVPLVTVAGDPLVGIGGSDADVSVLESLTNRTVETAAPRLGCAGGDVGFAFIRGATRTGSPVTMPVQASCTGRIELDAYVADARPTASPRLALFRGGAERRVTTRRAETAAGIARFAAFLDVRRGDVVGLVPQGSGEEVLGIVAHRPDEHGTAEHGAPIGLLFGIGGTVRIPPGSETLVLHESSDPSWQALEFGDGPPRLAPKFVADGFANGWTVRGGSTVVLFDLAQAAFVFGLLVAAFGLAVVWRLSFAPYVRRRRRFVAEQME